MRKRYPVFGLVLIFLGGAGLLLLSAGGGWEPDLGWAPGMMGPGMAGRWFTGWYPKTRYASNGERIYYTGVSERTGPLPARGGPMWIGMRGGGCVACHGVEGRGGVPVMMGGAIPSDIRYEALTKEEHREDEKTREHPPYTDPLIKRAITEGIDPAGNPLDWTMPRWQMSPDDAEDLVAFLKTLK
ncbi:MAG: cytochrome c [Candidatus Tectomicrobia bacterium]|uniref:Cytochrome c n=1 Tax=Tectimicrobiota bacterium TaxID=2528274 RepID=A0A932GS38_UNCTE|nr:cytochrome c [Candidatus Tectomicrobia bacterium]